MVFQRKTIIVVVLRSKTKEAQSWFDPLDPTIVGSKGSNHGFPSENNYIPLGYHGKRLFILFCFLDLFFYNICYKDKKSATLCVAK